MTAIGITLGVLFLLGLAIGAYAWLAPRASAAPVAEQPLEDRPPRVAPASDWTREAGEEFAGLSAGARCDMVFAVADLNDEHSAQLLRHALDDPADAVALAAAHALSRRGAAATVSEYVQQHPGERAQRILETLTLLQG